MLLYAVASSHPVHGDSSKDGSGRSLDSPESQCSIGFQPVFCSRHRTAFSKLPSFFRDVYVRPPIEHENDNEHDRSSHLFPRGMDSGRVTL